MTAPTVTETLVRVNYSETDQMGVAYHARYLVWLDVARTEHLRRRGASYRELEAAGLRLVVSEVSVRYRQPARFDDLLRIRCWVRRLESRRVEFGYAVDHADDGRLLATATVALLALDTAMALRRLPAEVGHVLTVVPDPVRLGFDRGGPHQGGTNGIHHRGTVDTEDIK
jgi:acyl-CoA thioester hydrolase